MESAIEGVFERVGRFVGTHPIKTIVVSVLFAFACGGGFSMLTSESRPEKQWVARGALALEHNDYVKETWPGQSRFDLWTATCADVDAASCNILEPKYIRRLHEINQKVMGVVIDGDSTVDDLDTTHKRTENDDPARRPWTKYAGNWSFTGRAGGGGDSHGRACFSFGPFCAEASILEVFRDDTNVINNLNTERVQQAVNFWEKQEGFCPLSLATAGSPCLDNNCQKYDTDSERQACRSSTLVYCNDVCPVRTLTSNGQTVTVPVDADSCKDQGCVELFSMTSGMLNSDGGSAPAMPSTYVPAPLKTMVGGLTGSGSVKYTNGKHLAGYWALNKMELYCPSVGRSDPLGDEWERRVLCLMGIDADPRAEPKLDCPADDLLTFNGLFGRSFGDEFGAAIRGDIAKLSSSYFVIIIYCGIMLGKRDVIHSGIALSITAVTIIGFTIVSTMGLMGYIGVPNSNLNSNLYFLILGLGVDDAFVLTSEYVLHATKDPTLTIPELVARTAKSGGISVLITSATDALAFLVGASTVLPALGWFCTYAGVAVIFCFLFQIVIFLPALALNAQRAQANRRDCFCCCTAEERPIHEPRGCCLCCTPRLCGDNMLRRHLKRAAEMVTTTPGRIVTILLFLVLAGLGIAGSTLIYKDFKLEWFIPDDSYVNEFFTTNSENFASGTKISVNMRSAPDAFEAQSHLHELYSYLNTAEVINKDAGISSWYEDFMVWAVAPNQAATASASFSPSRSDPKATFTDRGAFFAALHTWYRTSAGSRYRGSLLWTDADCSVDSSTDGVPAGCDVTQGLKASRFNAELTLASTEKGTDRYDTMTSLRSGVDKAYPGAFPFNFDFLYWEEVGIIDTELIRNLIICGAVVMVVVFLLVPSPRIAVWVILCIGLSIIDTLGFMYFWDVTISGVSTIYILICVGLSVDYAAHIAHMFKDSHGDPRERAIAAVERIGPCTFNAVVSTFLAVVVVGFSNSYVFRIFFKVLFLVVVIAGAHGLWLLPVILSIAGGSKEPHPNEVAKA